ncbi:Protein TIC 55, chloroplastic [Coccomyxa sp. Obi]|nr:Protein TIC 55, chloroplastic [Coccomyxa sp. Obi]
MASTSQRGVLKDSIISLPYGKATSKRSKRFHVSRTASSPMAYKTEDTHVGQGPRRILRTNEEHEGENDAVPPFQWSKHWYPVSVEDCLLKDKPNKVTLLGRDYVVWEDKGLWNVARDECPHRFAPLSVGRVQDGQLFCRYHGWGFEGGQEGRCVCNPQADGPKAEQTTMQSSRSRLETYPCQVQQGMLWIWPESGADAWLEAAATPPDTVPEMVDPSFAGSEGSFSWMENPASNLVMLENALDPSHASYVHNLVISKREDAAPMQMQLSGDIDPQKGFILEHGGYSKSQQENNLKAKRYFIPPCTIRTHYKYDSGREDMTTLYLVPVAPGVTRAYNKVVVKGVPNLGKKVFNFLAKNLLSSGYFHAFGHGLVDQDMNVLHSQERKLASKQRGWRDYYLATQSDTGVSAFWRWLNTYAGGDVTYSDGIPADLPPQMSNEELLNHYERHTKYCPACQKAVKRLDQVLVGLLVAGGLAAAAAVLAVPPSVGLEVFGMFLQARILLGLVGAGLLYLRRPVQAFRQRFFSAEGIIG